MVFITTHGGHCRSDADDVCYELGDIRRYDRVIEIANKFLPRQKRVPVYILIGCGISSKFLRPGDEDKVIFEYLVEHGIPEDIIITNPKGYSTITEIVAMRQSIQKKFVSGDTVISVSSWYHLPRIWIVWKLLYDIAPKLRAARPWEEKNFKRISREIRSILKTFFLICFRKREILRTEPL